MYLVAGRIADTYDWSSLAKDFFDFYLPVYFFDFVYFPYLGYFSFFDGDLSLLFDFDLSDLASSPFFLLFELFYFYAILKPFL
jgi:hypothetical protein